MDTTFIIYIISFIIITIMYLFSLMIESNGNKLYDHCMLDIETLEFHSIDDEKETCPPFLSFPNNIPQLMSGTRKSSKRISCSGYKLVGGVSILFMVYLLWNTYEKLEQENTLKNSGSKKVVNSSNTLKNSSSRKLVNSSKQ